MIRLSRRDVVQAMVAGATIPAIVGQAVASTAAAKRAYAVSDVIGDRFTPLPFESQQLGGLFADRMQANVRGRLLHIDERHFLEGFVHPHASDNFISTWVGEHAGKFLDAACNSLRYRDDADLRKLTDRVAQTLVSSQAEDGYLGTYTAERRWKDWDVWVHKYDLIGLLAYYELTGDARALNASRKIGELLCRAFGEGPGQKSIVLSRPSDDPGGSVPTSSILEPICTLYRVTGDPRYLTFARYIVRSYDDPQSSHLLSSILERNSVFGGRVGHAYTFMSNLNGVLDLYRLTGEENLLKAVNVAWEDIRAHQLYMTGAVCAGEMFQPPGRLLSLPPSNIGETCATVTWLQLTSRLLRLTGETKYGQEIERAVYNHLLAAQDPSNGDFCYFTAFAGIKEFSAEPLCCVSSGPRGVALLPSLVWGVGKDESFIVNLYTSGRASFPIRGVPVEIISDTQFPVSGDVMLSVNPATATTFNLRLRVPEWASRFEVQAGGQTLSGAPGQMLDLRQTWRPNSAVRIRMDMPVQVLDGGSAYPDFVAVKRGPQILALERSLNTEIPQLSRAGLTAERAPELSSAAGTAVDRRTVYEIAGIAAVPGESNGSKLIHRKLRMVPFADARDYQVWLYKAGRLPADLAPATLFARVGMSHAKRTTGMIEGASQNIVEYVTDGRPGTFLTVDSRGMDIEAFLIGSTPPDDSPAWVSAVSAKPIKISRVVFTHGRFEPDGGWFDTTKSKPRLEVSRQPIPVWSQNLRALQETPKWEPLAVFDSYPQTDASKMPDISQSRSFEVRLQEPQEIYAIRVIGQPANHTLSCAELSAYIS
jgi:DUF1680 family protein